MNQQEHEFRDYLRILKARKWTVVLSLLVVLSATAALSLKQVPRYATEARLLLKPVPTLTYPNPLTEAEVVASSAVARLVQENLSTTLSVQRLLLNLSVEPLNEVSIGQSEVLRISYVSDDPQFAQSAANSFADSYVQYRRDQALEQARVVQQSIEERMEGLRDRLDDIIEEIQSVEATTGGQERVATLDAERSILAAQLGSLQQQLDDAAYAVIGRSGGGEILEAAPLPTQPVSPNFLTNGLLGGAIGIFLGLGLALLREHLDDRFTSREDIERSLDVPVLATIPKFSIKRKQAASTLIVHADPKSAATEAYRNLRTNLEFLLSESMTSSVLITSPSPGEGKTTTTANLGVALAAAGRRVVLVSGDLRRPSLERFFGVSTEQGLSSWLLGELDNPDQIIKETGIDDVALVPCGNLPQNPAELLTSLRLPEIIGELKSRYDVVLVDSAPVLPVADSIIIAPRVGQVILVLDASSTHRTPAFDAKEQLERVGAKLVGTVLNALELSSPTYYYNPYYTSNYQPKASSRSRAGRRGRSAQSTNQD